jgi:large subunit ribosomal protein L4e
MVKQEIAVYDENGNVLKHVKLPEVFSTPYRKEIIKRAVLAEQTWEKQPKGNYIWAGMETSATYVGRKEAYKSLKNRGQAMRPREFYGGGVPGRVRVIPSSVKGRRAHPPKVEKVIKERINKKEYALALKSAIAATANINIVKARGHKIEQLNALPIVISSIPKKTKDTFKFIKLIIPDEIKRAKERRGKKNKYPKSALVVCTKEELKNAKAFENINGFDVVAIEEIKVKHLAPGTHAGRLSIFTEKAIEYLKNVDIYEKILSSKMSEMMENKR